MLTSLGAAGRRRRGRGGALRMPHACALERARVGLTALTRGGIRLPHYERSQFPLRKHEE
eukprot:COSAG01_NODE_13839_length_1528_cov_1.241428_3_plen_59_part_01